MTSDKQSLSGGFGLDSIFELTLVCSSVNLTLWLFIVLFRLVLSHMSAHCPLRTTPTCLVAHSIFLQRMMSSSHSPCIPTQPIGLSMTTQLQPLLIAILLLVHREVHLVVCLTPTMTLTMTSTTSLTMMKVHHHLHQALAAFPSLTRY